MKYKILQDKGINKKIGYKIKKNILTKKDYESITKDLTLTPRVHKDFAANVQDFECYFEDDKNIYLPKYWALENIGKPKKNLIKRGDYFEQELKTVLEPRDYQIPIIKKTYKQLKDIGGGVITVAPGAGKTFMAIRLSTLLKQKTLILVHTTVLLEQWIDRINFFLPNARIGKIKGKVFDIENKDYVIGMLQTLVSDTKNFKPIDFESFGLTVYDEVHHMAAPSFSKAFPLVSSKYNLGLSATPKRSDNLQCIFYWNIGPPAWQQENKGSGKFAIVKSINYNDDRYVEKYKWNGSIDLHKLSKQIIENNFRNNYILTQLRHLSKTGRQILVLSNVINHLKEMKRKFDSKIIYKNYPRREIFNLCKKNNFTKKVFKNIVSFIKEPVTNGMYIGGMKSTIDTSLNSKTHSELDEIIIKNLDNMNLDGYYDKIYNKKNQIKKKINLSKEDKIILIENNDIKVEIKEEESLEKSSKSDVLFASYQLVSEGTDIPTLNTLIMISPKKEVEQVVGRILRAKTKFTPLIIDICDNFGVYQNQSKYRKRLYKKCKYDIQELYVTNNDKDYELINDFNQNKKMNYEKEKTDNFNKCLL